MSVHLSIQVLQVVWSPDRLASSLLDQSPTQQWPASHPAEVHSAFLVAAWSPAWTWALEEAPPEFLKNRNGRHIDNLSMLWSIWERLHERSDGVQTWLEFDLFDASLECSFRRQRYYLVLEELISSGSTCQPYLKSLLYGLVAPPVSMRVTILYTEYLIRRKIPQFAACKTKYTNKWLSHSPQQLTFGFNKKASLETFIWIIYVMFATKIIISKHYLKIWPISHIFIVIHGTVECSPGKGEYLLSYTFLFFSYLSRHI